MATRRRFPWTLALLLGLFAVLAYYLGGGLWGWGGGRGFEEVASMPESSPSELVRKQEEFLRLAASGPAGGRTQAAARAEALGKILDLWAEDRLLSAQSRVEALLGEGKRGEASALLDGIPKEYLGTRFGPEFEALRRRVADS